MSLYATCLLRLPDLRIELVSIHELSFLLFFAQLHMYMQRNDCPSLVGGGTGSVFHPFGVGELRIGYVCEE